MRAVLLAVAIMALAATAVAQPGTCSGLNVTTHNTGFGSHICPFGYISDTNQGRCWTYRQAVNNFLYAPCHVDGDCGPLANDPNTGAAIMVCGTDKTCTWQKTRASGDSCTVNANCYSYGSVKYGCDKTTQKCRVQTTKYVATVGQRCRYDDYADTIECTQPSLTCSGDQGTCKQRLEFGEKCLGSTVGCRTDAVCTGPIPANYTCQALKNIGETCYSGGSSVECVQTTPAYCHSVLKTCQPYKTAYQNCNVTEVCNPVGLKCLNNPWVNVNQCLPPAWSNETCGANVCATGLTCLSQGPSIGRCFAGNLTDPCHSLTSGSYPDTCKYGLVCLEGFCANKVGAGENCTLNANMCQDNLFCYSGNNTCVAYQGLGAACHEPSLVPLQVLRCNTTLHTCSRGKCIVKNSLPVDAFCTADIDCDAGYCDPLNKKCTRRKMCASSSTGCQCVCSAGLQNLGQCILDNCGKYNTALTTCLKNNNFTTTAPYAWLDSASSFYSACKNEFNDKVRCNGLMFKWGAPSVPLGDLILYDLGSISASSSVSLSIMAIVAFVMSAFMLL